MHKEKLIHSKGNFRLWVFLLLVLVAPLLQSCHYFGMDPESSLPPGRRDFVWSVRSLPVDYSYNFYIAQLNGDIVSIYGSRDSISLYRKVSLSWEKYLSFKTLKPNYDFIPFTDSRGDLWISYYSSLAKLEGNRLTEITLLPDSVCAGFEINSVTVDDKGNRYFCGMQYKFQSNVGFIVKEDGNTFKQFFPEITEQYQFVEQVLFSDGKMYFLAGFYGGEYCVYCIDNNKPILLAKFLYDNNFVCKLSVINGRVYLVRKDGVYSIGNGEIALLRSFPEANFKLNVFFNGVNDIFWTENNQLIHFNGKDCFPIYSLPSTAYLRPRQVLVLKNELYLNYYQSDSNYIVHGVLP